MIVGFSSKELAGLELEYKHISCSFVWRNYRWV